MKGAVAAIALALALGACAQAPSSGPKFIDSPGGPFSWDSPRPDGLYLEVSDISSITSFLKFTPLEPRLNGLLHIDLTDPARIDPEGMLLFFFYQDPTYGRIIVKEQLNRTDQAALEAMLQYNEEQSSTVVFSLVPLDDGTQALVEIGKSPSEDGLRPNSVEFLEGDADITIFGPDSTFTSDAASQVAKLVVPVK